MTAGLLTGCGGSGKNGSSGDDNKLYVYNWGEYIDESVIERLEKETGIQVSTTYLKPTKKCIL